MQSLGIIVSTHSRAEVAAIPIIGDFFSFLFQHTAARRRLPLTPNFIAGDLVRFNTQPRGGGCQNLRRHILFLPVSTHSRAEAAARWIAVTKPTVCWFQHTAARRRLPCFYGFLLGKGWCFNTQPRGGGCTRKLTKGPYSHCVSTHSRAEAAAQRLHFANLLISCFNTQPRGGGCTKHPKEYRVMLRVSTHSRAEAAADHGIG